MGPPTVMRALLCIIISGVLMAEAEEKKMVACYFTNWSQYRTGIGSFKPEHVDPHLCTHLFFAFAKINDTLNTIEPIEWNYASLLHPGILKLKQANPKLKLILSVGGYNAVPSGWLSASRGDRVNRFASNVVTYLRRDRFDGVDIDWETPDQTTKSDYFRLMKALRSAIDREQVRNGEERLLLVTDVAANKHKLQYYSPKDLARLVDYVIVMAYDFYGSWSKVIGHHSPLFLQGSEPEDSFFSQHQAVEMWRQAGVPLDKMVLGLAAYGRAMEMTSLSLHRPGDPFTGKYPHGAPHTKEEGFYAYYEACNFIKQNGWREVFMTDARVPYVYGKHNGQLVWIGYDNPRSITEKTVYAVSRGMAGVMLWALDFDDFTGTVCGQETQFPLLRAINQVFDKTPRCAVDKNCELDEVKGVCIAGFCGCAKNTFISTKNFCTGENPPPAVPARHSHRRRRPSTSTRRRSRARGLAFSSQRAEPFRQSSPGSGNNPSPRKPSGSLRRRPAPKRSSAVSIVESPFKHFAKSPKTTPSSDPGRDTSSRHSPRVPKETSSSKHPSDSPKESTSPRHPPVLSKRSSIPKQRSSIPKQSSSKTTSRHTSSSERSSGPEKDTSSFGFPRGVSSPRHPPSSPKETPPSKHSPRSSEHKTSLRHSSPSPKDTSSPRQPPSPSTRTLSLKKSPGFSRHTVSRSRPFFKHFWPSSGVVNPFQKSSPKEPSSSSKQSGPAKIISSSKHPGSSPQSIRGRSSAKRSSRSSRVVSPYKHSHSYPRADSFSVKSWHAQGGNPFEASKGRSSPRVVSPYRPGGLWSKAHRRAPSAFNITKAKTLTFDGGSPFSKPSTL